MQGDTFKAYIGGYKVAEFSDSNYKAGNILLGTLAPRAKDFNDPTEQFTIAQFDNLNVTRL